MNELESSRPTMDHSCPACGHQGPHDSFVETERVITVYLCSTSACGTRFIGEICTKEGCAGTRGGSEDVAVKRHVKVCGKCQQKFIVTVGMEIPLPYELAPAQIIAA